MMLSESDRIKIRQKSSWDENSKTWQLPYFVVHERKGDITFPTINGQQRVEQHRRDQQVKVEAASCRDEMSQGRQFNGLGADATAESAGQSRTRNFNSRINTNHKSSMELGAAVSDMIHSSRRENSAAAIRNAADKLSFLAKNSGSVESMSKLTLDAQIIRPNDRHHGIALAPLPHAPSTTRNTSLPKKLEDDEDDTLNVHPIHAAHAVTNAPQRNNKLLEAIDHSNHRVQMQSANETEANPLVGALNPRAPRFRTLEPLQKQ